MIPYCNAHGIGLIPWSPLHQGALARPLTEVTVRQESLKGSVFESVFPLTESDKVIIARVKEVSKKKGWKMSEVALAWIDGKVVSPIVGCNSVSYTGSLFSVTFSDQPYFVSRSALRLRSFVARRSPMMKSST